MQLQLLNNSLLSLATAPPPATVSSSGPGDITHVSPPPGTFSSFLEIRHTDKGDPNNKLQPFVRQRRENAHNQCGNTETLFRKMNQKIKYFK